ncbi:hypothetical protein B0H11DRAFT_1702034, partial [Mycena galericulata]
GVETIAPPISFCPRPSCDSHKLGEESRVEARLFTLRRGILPVFSTSLYCHRCSTRYYHNYSVEKASGPNARNMYYTSDVPSIIHVTDTCFVETPLCIYFEMQMAISQGGIARVYNTALTNSDSIPNSSRLIHELTGELVLDSFLFHAILRDKSRRREILSVPHANYQNHRLDEALAERNYRFAGTGQPQWPHACDGCMKVYQGEDDQWYRMTAGVHDGITVRHVCCSVHDCTEPLPTQRSLFCHTHRDRIKICCIHGCKAEAEAGFRTCTLPAHREFQKETDLRNTAMFQLHARLRNAGISQVPVAGSTPKVRGHISRSWTHNEQLFVRCCGIIISRATFFGSEGIAGVKDFLKATFPSEYPGSLPSYIFYDNNCQFLKHLGSSGDHYFDNVGLPVDVFHFKCKHTIRDGFCQVNCNPAQFLELIGENGKWVFNSSATEQANVWFGKFQNTVQEMPVLRFNFFLDEMIYLRNEKIIKDLREAGRKPHLQDEALLRGALM